MFNNNVTKQLFEDFLNLFYPRLCAGCGGALLRHEMILCAVCNFNLPLTGFHNMAGNPVERIFWGRVRLERAFSLLYFRKGGLTQSILHEIKYHGNSDAAVYMGKMMGREFLTIPVIPKPRLLIPVPLHPAKEKIRGFNQSASLATGFSEVTGIPVAEKVLFRTKHITSQTRKERWQRADSMSEVFKADATAITKPCHLLLIDDVVTTGSTAEACLAALSALNGCRLSFASLACA